MPAWKSNPKVIAGRDQIYAYLMARSDGAIGVVKPKNKSSFLIIINGLARLILARLF